MIPRSLLMGIAVMLAGLVLAARSEVKEKP